MQMSIHSPLPALGKRVFVFQKPCPPWASDLFLQFAFACIGQAIYFSICLCLHWASDLFFNFTFARSGQAFYFSILPLPKLGKSNFF